VEHGKRYWLDEIKNEQPLFYLTNYRVRVLIITNSSNRTNLINEIESLAWNKNGQKEDKP